MNSDSGVSITEQTAVVILAAGKGERMGREDLAKVCFDIDGTPAISRLVSAFKRHGFGRFVVVVGSMAEQVLATVVKEHPEVIFVYQARQLGTGHAAKVAADALKAVGHRGCVLATLGDKFVEPAAIEALVEGYLKQQADLALLTIPKTKAGRLSSGRVLVAPDGQVVGIVEKTDLGRQEIVDELRGLLAAGKRLTGQLVKDVIDRHIPNKKKQSVAVSELLSLAEKGGAIARSAVEGILNSPQYQTEIDGQRYSAKELETRSKDVNPSLYFFSADSFYLGVEQLTDDNAQGEYYLTDVVRHLGAERTADGRRRYRVRPVPVSDPKLIQGFNSPDELLAIQDHVRRRASQPRRSAARPSSKPPVGPSRYCTVRQWIDRLQSNKPRFRTWLRKIYGSDEQLHAEKRKLLLRAVRCYGRRFGLDEEVVIVRAPGRINLMGRHVDHRGGFNNFLAIDRETIAVAGLRKDDKVIAVNTQPRKYKAQQFSISQLLGQMPWRDWMDFANSQWVRDMLRSSAGDWSNYIKAALLRLQHQYQDLKISGINIVVCGNIPMGAGLSSSSTLVVATLQAAIALNGLRLTGQQFIDLCGQGEWVVDSGRPSRAAGDHAAIYLGQRGKIAHVGYLPFRVEKMIDAPRDYSVIIANSQADTVDQQTATNTFNARLASYDLGLSLLKQRCPEIAHAVEHVRDINTDKLGCVPSEIFKMLLKLPEFMTRKDFQALLSGQYRELMESRFATHQEPNCYNVRGVLLFGAAEVMRSSICVSLLESNRIEQFGQLMKISHNGDRVVRPEPDNQYRAVGIGCSDDYLNRLIADLASEDPRRVLNAQIYMQPGSYACSTPQIDEMVDIVCSVNGVAGAQMAGAGLGGCVMALVRRDNVAAVRRTLAHRYYRPRGLSPAVIEGRTVAGAGLAES